MQKFFARFLSVLVLFSAIPLFAQNHASMTGVVTDKTGAVIAGVSVTLTQAQTGTTYTQTTDNAGLYRFTVVAPGTGYKVIFTREGFSSKAISDLSLAVAQTRTQNAVLAVGSNVESVQVSSANDTVTINTTDATVGNNIDVKELNELPIYNRTSGITTLFYMQAGVDPNSNDDNAQAVTGARIDQSEVSIDGLDVNDISSGLGFNIVGTAPVDSVEQFTANIAGLNADTGTGSGGQYKLVTKGGTNKFHGNLNEYHRDTTTVSNSWFNNFNGLKRTPLIHNQFGGDVGGPILRNKLFFYFDWGDSRIVQSSTTERVVPLDDFRAGKLDYVNSGAGCSPSSRINNAPGCLSSLSANQVAQLDPAGTGLNQPLLKWIAARYPVSNDHSYASADGVNTGGYRFSYATPDTRHSYVGRIDYNLTATQKIFGRFTITRRDATQSLPEFDTDPSTHPYQDRSYAYVVGHTWNIGQNKVNQFAYGDTIQKVSFPDLYNPTGANQFGFSGLSGPYTSYNGQQRRVPIPVVRDDFSWTKGNHSISFGGSFKFIKTNSLLVNDFNFISAGMAGSTMSGGFDSRVRPGDILSDPTVDPNGLAATNYDTMLATGLGAIGEVSTNFTYDKKQNPQAAGTGAHRAYRFFQTEFYAGDNWKVTPKLTLSYGVRYQLYSVPYEVKGLQSEATSSSGTLDLNAYMATRVEQGKAGNTSNTALPTYSYVLAGKANHGPAMYDMNYKDFAPRVGFAYTPYRNGKTVINGSAGIVYDRTVINAIAFLADQNAYLFYSTNTFIQGGNDAVDALGQSSRIGANLAVDPQVIPSAPAIGLPYKPFVDSTGTPYGLATGQSNFIIDPKLKDPYSIALNFGVQQDLPWKMVAKINYVGRLGRRLLADVDSAQVIDVPDYSGKSTQTMAQAFAGLTTELRAGKSGTALTQQPWFENNMGYYQQGARTRHVASLGGTLPRRGDISDTIQTLAGYSYNYGIPIWPTNIGMPAQFGTNAYLTNKGSSNYNGLLLTVDKNMSNGLRFEFNYTWSHSIDNTSQAANQNSMFNNSGMICDYYQPRACRGDSDFDVRQTIASNFIYELPIGHGRTYLNHLGRALDEIVGGWTISGIPSYRTGIAYTANSHAYMAGFDNMDPAIFTGKRADLKAKINVDHTSHTVWSFAGGATGAAKVASEFRGPIGLEYGQRNYLRGPGYFNIDAGLAKDFQLVKDTRLRFRADTYNLTNHPSFDTGAVDIVSNAGNFGQISATSSGLRVAQFSLRLEF
jgi:hypothetical protein